MKPFFLTVNLLSIFSMNFNIVPPFETVVGYCRAAAVSFGLIQFFKGITDTLYLFEEGFIEVGLLIVLRHNEEVFAP